MELVSMKEDKKEQEMTAPIEAGKAPEGDSFPYGLRITLSNSSLKKLGLDDVVGEFDIDNEIMLTAKCLVKRVEKSKGEYGDERDKENQSLELQITDLGIESEGEKPKDEEDDSLDWDERSDIVDEKLKKKGY